MLRKLRLTQKYGFLIGKGVLLNPSDKTNLKRRDKYVALSNLNIQYTWKNLKKKLYKSTI